MVTSAAGRGMDIWYAAFFNFPGYLVAAPLIFIVTSLFFLLLLRCKLKLHDWLILVVVPVILFCVTPLAARLPKTPGYVTFMQSFTETLRQTSDPEKIQGWAVELLKTRPKKKPPDYLDRNEIPMFVKELWPGFEPRVVVERDANASNDCVLVDYRGVEGLWGVAVGDFRLTRQSDEAMEYSLWKPGVYFFHSKH